MGYISQTPPTKGDYEIPSVRPAVVTCLFHQYVRDTPLHQSTPNLVSIFFGQTTTHLFHFGNSKMVAMAAILKII